MARTTKLDDITFRKLLPVDRPAFEGHLLSLGEESRRSRFGMAATDDFLREYAERCITLNAIIHGAFRQGELIGVAELRPFPGFPHDEAELAFSVAENWRNAGIGTALFGKLLRSARNRGFTKLYMTCIARNASMRSLARKFSAEVRFERGETFGIVETNHPTIISLLMEVIDDASNFAMMAWSASAQLPKFATRFARR